MRVLKLISSHNNPHNANARGAASVCERRARGDGLVHVLIHRFDFVEIKLLKCVCVHECMCVRVCACVCVCVCV